jgi:membrane-bound lytic murein transglycosylase B
MRFTVFKLQVLLCAACVVSPPAAAAGTYAGRPEVVTFIDEMVGGYGYDRATLARAFAAARYQPRIIEAMQRPLVAPPKWYEYAPPLVAPSRVEQGVVYWNAHAEDLARAEERYGVAPEIIVAILGVETLYGRNTGGHRALDALATLAFDYPRRGAFFRAELREFLLLARELGVDPAVPKGSFAGALGVPQFMPGSYREFAVDFDGDGRIDLWSSPADIVGSVASYLARHDWQRGQPVLLPAAIAEDSLPAVRRRLDGGISERRSAEAWSNDGVAASGAPFDLAADPVALLMLEEKDADGIEAEGYWIACQNFYVLTRYNRSRLYAAAVHELATRIRLAH